MNLRADVKEFLTLEMCIDVGDLLSEINQPCIGVYSKDLIKATNKFHDALSILNSEDRIQKIFTDFEYLHKNERVHGILDALRHAFDSFAYDGLHQLYTRQENESWYPKIKLVRELKPNDIKTLKSIVNIYRGCNKSEYDLKNFGQAWTTSKNIAKKFAFEHYILQEWFDINERVVLSSSISRKEVFYSKQYMEYEVVVNTKMLGKVKICS